MDLTTPATDTHPVLFRHVHGRRIRLLARAGVTLALIAMGIVAVPTLQASERSLGVWVITGLLVLFSGGFGYAAWQYARRFAVHFEIWPQSQLAVVRTAGLWRERILLVPWIEFSAGYFSAADDRSSDQHRVIRLRSGQILMFEPLHGDAPHGWAALQRFLDKCSLPESTAAVMGTVTAESRAPLLSHLAIGQS